MNANAAGSPTHPTNPQECLRLASETDRELHLPPRKLVPFSVGDETGWASHYGGLYELAKYARLLPAPPLDFPATWQHGIIEEWRYRKYPKQLLYGINHEKDRLILVANKGQREALSDIGYKNVHAFGSPFAYAKPESLPKRIPNSVLIMPAHALRGAPFENNRQIEAYCDFIHSKYINTSHIVYACIHISCLENNQWAPSFARRGIRLIAGAQTSDRNSYKRMWHLFSSFETVSTSGIGSHIFYSLAAGSQLIIEGPEVKYSKRQMMKDRSFQRALANQEAFLDDTDLEMAARQFKQRFSEARADPNLGQAAVGIECMKSPKEVRSLLGWHRRQQLRSLPRYTFQQSRQRLRRRLGVL